MQKELGVFLSLQLVFSISFPAIAARDQKEEYVHFTSFIIQFWITLIQSQIESLRIDEVRCNLIVDPRECTSRGILIGQFS